MAAAPVLATDDDPTSPLAPVAAGSSERGGGPAGADADSLDHGRAGGPLTLPPLDGTDLAALLASNQEVLTAGLAATDVPTNLRPSLSTATGDRAPVYADDCVAIGVDEEPKPCRYGDPATPTKVVLYGDSHAAQWSPPLIEMAEAGQFELVVLVKGGCPTAAVSIPTDTLARTCPIWRDRALEIIAAEQPDLTVVSAWSGYPNTDADWSAGLTETMSRWRRSRTGLVVLGDNPPSSTGPAACLSNHLRSANECAAVPEDVVASGRIDVERRVADGCGRNVRRHDELAVHADRVPADHRRHPPVPGQHPSVDRRRLVVPSAARGQPAPRPGRPAARLRSVVLSRPGRRTSERLTPGR